MLLPYFRLVRACWLLPYVVALLVPGFTTHEENKSLLGSRCGAEGVTRKAIQSSPWVKRGRR
jgi:hypothetical protein